ncbi:shikimate dehydrogenase [Sedimentibacter sp. B4]|uniref:shikimate dehydrogenase n=1 Tax=Sedimentibacter sp. B4 TaxID=304766 RepID=UPI0003087F7F|nr:shikimate dehydrogenase [Sedimentibacter sp. B4]
MIISTKTKLLGLLGYPLGHSLSPIMHNTAFESLGLGKIYIPIEVLPENLETVVRGMAKMNFEGFNVTIPHKIEIMKYLDEIDEYAKCIGAVNTVVVHEGTLKGYNTDGMGFLKSFEESTGTKINGKNVFILGSGGASRAISMTLALKKANKIFICNRTYEKAVSLADDINKQTGADSVAVKHEYDEMKKAIADCQVLINTTSVGMSPDIDSSPLDRELLNPSLTVCDAVYNPRKTRLLKDAEEMGCTTVEGLKMLVNQGAEAFEIWTGIKAPAELMLKAISK